MVGATAAAKPARILMVEDDPQAAMTIVRMLRAAWPDGLLVIQAYNTADAISEVVEHGVTCVLLALAVDEGPAFEQSSLDLVRELTAAAPEAPVIVLSGGDADTRTGLAAVAAGAQDHLLVSELGPERLSRAVRYAIERKRAVVALGRQALEDPLTALPNRILLGDRLTVAQDRARRTGRAPALMFLDLDAFKTVNDTRGHAAGDELLRVLADRFRSMLRPMDTVARIGGDEFTFLFEGLAGYEEALRIANRVAEAAARPVNLDERGLEVAVSASVGITILSDPEATLADAMREADAAMYRAKGAGGARAELFEPAARARGAGAGAELLGPAAQRRAESRASTEEALRTALSARQLRVHYQPQVSIDDRTGLVGFEALVRWAHPERGLIAPAEFVPLAEATGLIAPLGDWVIEQALAHVHRWRRSRPQLTVSINLSPHQLADPAFVTRLAEAIERQRVDPAVVSLELPEATVLGDPTLAAVIDDLRGLGVRLAIDDFGRAGAAPRRLRELPVDTLKLDAGLVSGLAGADRGAAVAAAVALGHALGLDVVAKGVETDLQCAQLQDLGCDGAQGFLFGEPVPDSAVRTLLGEP